MPTSVALLAIALAIIWQLATSSLLNELLCKALPEARRPSKLMLYCLAWLLVPAVFGGLMVAMALPGKPLRIGVVQILYLMIIACAAYRQWCKGWPLVGKARALWQSAAKSRWTIAPILIVAVFTLFAATPQNIYDQMSYHLVVPNMLLHEVAPNVAMLDSHFYVTGAYEFGLAWLVPLLPNTDLLIGAAQVYTWLLAFGATFMIVWQLLQTFNVQTSRSATSLFFALALLTCFPDGALARFAKPDILLGVAVGWMVVAAMTEEAERWAALGFLLAISLLALKTTALLSTAAFMVLFAWLCWSRRRVLEVSLPLLSLVISPVILVFATRVSNGATMFFPADIKWFDAPEATITARQYWPAIARPQLLTNTEFVVHVVSMMFGHPIVLSLVICGVALAFFRGRQWRSLLSSMWCGLVIAFSFFLLAIVGFGANPFWRFWSPGICALFFTAMYAVFALTSDHPAPRKWVMVIVAIGMLAFCRIDVAVGKLWRFHRDSISVSMNKQLPMRNPSLWLNDKIPEGKLVVGNDHNKVYLLKPLLYHYLSSREIAAWQEIESSLDHGKWPDSVGALVVRADAIRHDCVDPALCPHEYPSIKIYPRLVAFAKEHLRAKNFGLVTVYVLGTDFEL